MTIKRSKEKQVNKTEKNKELQAMLNLFYKWDIANKRVFANKTEREAAQDLLKIKPLQEWEELILIDKFFDELYSQKYFPQFLVSYKPTEMLRNYKKMKAWISRNLT